MTSEQRVLCLAARSELNGEEEQRLGRLLRSGVDWERLWAEAADHDVGPLVAATLGRRKEIEIPTGWTSRADRHVYATLLRNTALAEDLNEVTSALRGAGVDSLAVKGVVLAETIYGNLALRPAADVDILVRPDDLRAARSVLRSLGFDHRSEPLGDEWTHSHHDEPYFRRTARRDVCLELHWALWPADRFRADPGVWERARPVEVGGSTIRTLSREDTLLHLAIHRTRSPLRLRSLCDVAELLRRDGAELDWEAVSERAAATGARTALYAVLSLSKRLLDAQVPPHVLARVRVGPLRRRALEPACGTAALFAPAPPGTIRRQVRTGLRAFEHDGARAIMRSFADRAARKRARRVDARAARGLPEPRRRREPPSPATSAARARDASPPLRAARAAPPRTRGA